MLMHPAEIAAIQERADRAERECQRLHEIISDKSASEYSLRLRIENLQRSLDAATAELRFLRDIHGKGG